MKSCQTHTQKQFKTKPTKSTKKTDIKNDMILKNTSTLNKPNPV